MKMNRRDITLKTSDFIKELKRELTMRWAVYAKQVQQKKLSAYEANKRYLIILELRELMESAEERGLTITQLKDMVSNSQVKSRSQQGQLFGSTKFPN